MNARSLWFAALLALAACNGGGGGGDGNNGGSGNGPLPEPDRGSDPFQFSKAAPETYSRVDRMGAPVVATVLLPTAQKDRFNAGDPADDGDFAEFMIPTLNRLHFELDGALTAAGFTPCAVDVCSRQAVPNIIPDVLRLQLDQRDGFPNGRRLEDSVVDRILAIALLDLTNSEARCAGKACTVDSLVQLPLNPAFNEEPYELDFPYLGLPHPPP
ncbi:MAG TPA: DUF4331 family protein [Solimonas sp.]|nr:DUF4331 family protein [Solimonas sp.]